MPRTVLSLIGPYSSSCGYCGETPGSRSSVKSSRSYGLYPQNSMLPCSVYMDMLDRGWRRSGTFVYKPDMKRTCCPQYTIRLDALKFSPTRSQRQVTNRWTRFVINGDKPVDLMKFDEAPKHKKSYTKASMSSFDLVTAIHSSEYSFTSVGTKPAHRFEVTLEPSTFSEEKFNLYKAYQRDIHKEQHEKSPEGFREFLVESPLVEEPIPYSGSPPSHLPKCYGSYHQCYRIDGELLAMAVLDILPGCVSSVYFIYAKKWERFSLGKISALRETALAREIRDAGVTSMDSLYMGFYIHSCIKMRYKGDYSPSYLLDPEEYSWFPYKECTPILDKHRYGCFSRPGNSLDDSPAQEVNDDVHDDVPADVLAAVNLLESDDLTIAVTDSWYWQHHIAKQFILNGIKALGPKVVQEVTITIY